MFLSWFWQALGGEVKNDVRSILVRFFMFDLYVWIFIAYGIRLWLLGELD